MENKKNERLIHFIDELKKMNWSYNDIFSVVNKNNLHEETTIVYTYDIAFLKENNVFCVSYVSKDKDNLTEQKINLSQIILYKKEDDIGE